MVTKNTYTKNYLVAFGFEISSVADILFFCKIIYSDG